MWDGGQVLRELSTKSHKMCVCGGLGGLGEGSVETLYINPGPHPPQT